MNNSIYCYIVPKKIGSILNNNKNPINSSPVSLSEFIKHSAKETFHVDSRIFRTLKTLILKPGTLTREYFRSSGIRYVQPLKLYFIINFLFFLITPLLNTQDFKVFEFDMSSLTSDNQFYQILVGNVLEKSNVSGEVFEERFDIHMKYNQPALIFLTIPIFAVFHWILNFGERKFFMEQLLFALHYLSFFLLLLMLLRIIYSFIEIFMFAGGDILVVLFLGGIAILSFLYLIISIREFYSNNKAVSVIKSILLYTSFVVTLGLYVHFLFFYTLISIKLGY